MFSIDLGEVVSDGFLIQLNSKRESQMEKKDLQKSLFQRSCETSDNVNYPQRLTFKHFSIFFFPLHKEM